MANGVLHNMNTALQSTTPPFGHPSTGGELNSPPVEGWQAKPDGVVPLEGWQAKPDGVVLSPPRGGN